MQQRVNDGTAGVRAVFRNWRTTDQDVERVHVALAAAATQVPR